MDTSAAHSASAARRILPVSRITPARGLAWLAVGCMIASAIGYLPYHTRLTIPALFMLAGGGALIGTLLLRRDWGLPPLRITAASASADGRVRWLPLLIGVLLLILLGLRGAPNLLPLEAYFLTPIPVQALLLLVGIALLVIGVGGVRRADLTIWRTGWLAQRREIWLVLAIMIVAFAIRMFQVGDAVKAFMDEGPFMNALVNMREHPFVPLTSPIHWINSFTHLFSYIQLVLSDLLGSNLVAFRLTSVIFGTLTVGAVYALARMLFDRQTAWLAALLLAVLPPHIHMSRIGINNIADPLFGVLALICFLRALHSKRRLYYALAGVMLGLLPYFYEGGELLFPALLLLWAGLLMFQRTTRPSLRGMGWMLLVAVLIALPVYFTMSQHDLPLFTRLDAAGVGGNYLLVALVAPNGFTQLADYWTTRLLPPLLHFIHAPDPSLFYSGQTALLLPVLVPLFLLGLFHGTRRVSGWLLLLWVLLTVLGNSLIEFNNWTARFVVAMPAMALLCAVGLRYTLPMIGLRRAWIYKSALLLLAVVQIVYYFGPHLAYYNEQIIGLRRHYDVVFRTMGLPPDMIVYFNYLDPVQVPFYYGLLKYVGDEHEFHAERFENYDFTNLKPDGRYAFFLNPLNEAALAKLEALWYLDGPYYDDRADLFQMQQFALYLATPWLRRDGPHLPAE